MADQFDQKDKAVSRKLAIGLLVIAVFLGVAIMLMIPIAAEVAAIHFAPGLGLKTSAIIAFFVTIFVLGFFAVVSGDGLLGEIQFVLGSFLLFFLIFWLMLAWLF